MLTVNISYNSKTRRLKLESTSTELTDPYVGTTKDNDATELRLRYIDDEGAMVGYLATVEFDVYVPSTEQNCMVHPQIAFDENLSVKLPNYVLKAVKNQVLPLQVSFVDATGVISFTSVNKLYLSISDAVRGQDVDVPPYIDIMVAVDDVTFDPMQVSYTVHHLNGTSEERPLQAYYEEVFGTSAFRDVGTSPHNLVEVDSTGKIPETLIPSIATSEHYTVTTKEELVGLFSAKNGDTAVVSEKNEWYILYGEYSVIDDWYQVTTNLEPIYEALEGKLDKTGGTLTGYLQDTDEPQIRNVIHSELSPNDTVGIDGDMCVTPFDSAPSELQKQINEMNVKILELENIVNDLNNRN